MTSLILSLFFLLLLSPILIIISIIILIDDGAPIIFKQKRIGKNNIVFEIYKFRTMLNNTPELATHLLKKSDNHYTSTGKFLRKYSLYELPQLINIIRGELSVIGPRPALYNQNDLIKLRTKKIHLLNPGITGWSQTHGRDNLTISEKVKLDYFYLKNKTFFLNFKIIYLTIVKVIFAKDVFS